MYYGYFDDESSGTCVFSCGPCYSVPVRLRLSIFASGDRVVFIGDGNGEDLFILLQGTLRETVSPRVGEPTTVSVRETVFPRGGEPTAVSVTETVSPRVREPTAVSVRETVSPRVGEPTAVSVRKTVPPRVGKPTAVSVRETVSPRVGNLLQYL